MTEIAVLPTLPSRSFSCSTRMRFSSRRKSLYGIMSLIISKAVSVAQS
jgi:hypothetical protein